MHIDTPTVLIALLIGYSMLVLDLGLARRSLLAQQPALRDWMLGSVLILAGLVAIPLRLWIPVVLGVLLTNVLLTAGLAFYTRAIWRFVRGSELPGALWLFTPVGLGLLTLAWLAGWPHHRLVSISSTCMALQTVPMVVVLLRDGWRAETSLRTVGITLSMCGLALGVRAVHAELDPGNYASLDQPGTVQGLMLLAGFVSSVGAGFGFVLACLERTAQQMEHLAARDGLTGCFNRTVTQTMLGHMLERCRRDGQPIALVLFDLDHFKLVNDRHGHLVGDQVLRQFAESVRGRIRASDVFGRMGGEEFCLGLPMTDRLGAQQVVETVRSSVESMALVGREGAALRITVSAGVAVADLRQPHLDSAELTIESLYGQADDQLYRAKLGGRNQAMVA
ncbi:GGDEF domain-containing protein [Sphaerotilus sp.]|jgi:diguanylate cyclase (GGDEF)-like protein|uniref:GGDEF domain-containing protein n=1 Tax=Sphaerotilus sp. TaxID=2093942 RepID=UPI0025EE4564|nr:GGDEF domain-containing protein [Sphaerotilus sp.]